MTLEGLLISKLIGLAMDNARLTRACEENFREVQRLHADFASANAQRDAAIAAHTTVMKRVDELEKQLGKRGGKRGR